MDQQSFLIIHGLGGSGPDHWQSWLAKELIKRNNHVIYPTFTNYNLPNKDIWLEELSNALRMIPEENNLTIITHSLGCFLWLHYASKQNKQIANQVILVAPPSPNHILTEAKSFFPVPLVGNQLKKVAEHTLFIHSTNDPYCGLKDSSTYANLGLPAITLPNAGHINTQSGHSEWPWMLELCLSQEKLSLYA
ncbi:RBBP9/YdeN family alpha/beta hydrolase [Neobacillus drentensis]|uniref:RBBP9/YdeN family alpha/beta hydrolase n=1 Tax=Neobacillus drentensis TaxID=220684 RepID=UPI002FFD8993